MGSHDCVTADKFGKNGWLFLAPRLEIWFYFGSFLD